MANSDREDGFTLIELLVVIIIIGILSAIAIPVFLNQRTKGYDAAAESDVRFVAENMEIYLNDKNSYGTIADMSANGQLIDASDQVTVTIVRYNGTNGYCLSSRHLSSPTTWHWDSQAGGLQAKSATGCPTTTSGSAGGSVSG